MSSTQNQPKIFEDDEAFSYATQVAGISILCMALKAVIELNLLEIIDQAGPHAHLSASEIASQLPTKNPEASSMIDRILSFLSSNSILTFSLLNHADGRFERLYCLTPVSKFFLRNQNNMSLAPLVLFNDKIFIDSWFHLKDAILEGGIPFNRTYGMNLFEYLGKDPRLNKIFNDGMLNHSHLTLRKILDTYTGFEGLAEIVDVAGGIGGSLNMIISKYPHIKGINFDLPHVITAAPAHSGIEHVAGDMFVSIPSSETILLKWILHDWNDEDCLKILRNCWKALPDSGKVVAIESILPVAAETNVSAASIFQLDMFMLTLNPGGRERTDTEFESLAKRAGFLGFKAICCGYDCWVMEFYKMM